MLTLLRDFPATIAAAVLPNTQRFMRSREPQVWLACTIIGALVAVAAVIFRHSIDFVQSLWLPDSYERMASAARNVHWLWLLAVPTFGGLIVGWMLENLLPTRRTGGVADVIEARAHGGRNIELKPGLYSALITVLSLGFGTSAGREGPIVHLGGTIATTVAHWFSFPDWGRRTLLACGVGAAISASFNAPIAGVLFAHEVVLQHYAKRSFVPIVIASTMGAIVSRSWFGDRAAFTIPEYQITSYLEFPSFALLGLVCALVAILFQFALVGTDRVARTIDMPLWLRPAVGGLMVGLIALAFPNVLGVGYEATSEALTNRLPVLLLLALIVAKVVATSITLASRFGGGVVSPSLYVGAMTGSAFGLIAADVFPQLASSNGLYAILGMAAVAAAVIGAPISTAVMVFELTGGYSLSIALLLTVSIAVGINQAVSGRSFFQWQLESRGLLVMDGPHKFVVRNTTVASFMTPLAEDEPSLREEDDETPVLRPDMTLETVLQMFDESGLERLLVVKPNDDTHIIGSTTQNAALRAYNKALVDISVEEHR